MIRSSRWRNDFEAYEHTGGWVNRLILGDSLVVMEFTSEYEGLGGEVQMIYIDPPLRREVWIELPAVCAKAQCQGRSGRRSHPRA